MRYTILAILFAVIFGFQFTPPKETVAINNSEKQISAKKPNKAITEKMYPISENELWGYIDSTGNVCIPPKFHSVGQFSEGLAPARLNGIYGFIDNTGSFVIPAKYDVAHSFYNGIAKVYLDTIPYFIDKQGVILFEHNFKEFNGFNKEGISIVNTHQDNYGIVNQEGILVVDTVYKKINEFLGGLAIITGINHTPYPDSEKTTPVYEKGVVNMNGDFIVPFGKYKDIANFVNGFARVEIAKGRQKEGYIETDEGIIDANGKLKFLIPYDKWSFDYRYAYFSEGLAIVDIKLKNPDNTTTSNSNDRDSFKGVINPDGEILFSNRNWDEITPFNNSRAFVKDINDNYFLINKKGGILNQNPYKDILFDTYNSKPQYLFQDNKAFVETSKGWGAIDTTGKFIVQPLKFDFNYRDLSQVGSTVFFSEDISVENESYSFQYGFWNTQNNVLIKPQFHDMQFSDFSNHLLYAMKNGQIGYIDFRGEFLWKEKEQQEQKEFVLNIDYMNRGYFYADSPHKDELMGLGGWGDSDKIFKKIPKLKKFDKKQLSMSVRPNENTKSWGIYKGIKLYIANTSKKTFYFEAQDSRLYLKIQAQDKSGKWRDIEYLPSSWCGNSYHTLFLPPKNYWEFVVPVYEGEFSTKMRAKLFYKKASEQRESDVLYSNEFEGSINPAQFWHTMPYTPKGLMDPYNE